MNNLERTNNRNNKNRHPKILQNVSSCALQKQRIFWKDVKEMHQRKDNKERDIKNHQEAERERETHL